MQNFYMGEKRLARTPVDLYVFELAWALHKSPDEIRQWNTRDVNWMFMVHEAKRLADEEMNRRGKERGK